MKKIFFLAFILLSCNKKDGLSKSSFLFENNKNISNQIKNNYLDSIYMELNKTKDDSIKLKNIFTIAAEYYYLKNNNASFKASKKAYDISLKLNDSLSLGRALYYIGDCFLDYQKDSAYYYYKESEKIFKKINNKDRLGKVYYNKAYLLFFEGNYVESEIEVIKALSNFSSTGNSLYIYRCYSLQGSNHLELGEYEKALEYFNLSTIVLNQMKEKGLEKDAFYDYEITNVIDLCTAYLKNEEYLKSIKSLEKIIKKGNFKNYPKLNHSVLENYAYSLLKINDYVNSKKYFNQALNLCKLQKDDLGRLYVIIDFGEYHLLTKDTLKANHFFNEALQLSKKLKNGKEILKSLDFLSITDKKNAIKYKSEYIRINDSIVKKQRENREKFARIEYETEKVEQKNKLLTNNNLLLFLVLAISIVIFLIILVIRNRISRKKELNLIKEKEKANQELLRLTKEFQSNLIEAKVHEQKKIAKELHDGIVNKIYGIRMMLGSLNEAADENSKLQRQEYIKELHKLETEIRSLSHNMNADFSKYVGEFNFLVEQLIHANSAIGTTVFVSDIAPSINWNQYSAVIKINIYRILQEALQNVLKYAKAKTCLVTITEVENKLSIEIKDDGVGFNTTSISEGIGLKNIKERGKSIGSEIEINSIQHKGTTIRLKVKNEI